MGLFARLWMAGVLGATCVVAGCGFTTSALDDAGSNDDDASTPDANASDGAPNDTTSQPDGNAGPDSPPPPPGECSTQMQENCTDGVDNNCDGLVDCADPQCKSAGYTCIAPPPGAPWRPVAAETDKRDPCPTGYAMPTDVVVDPSYPPATCTCNCTMGQTPTCLHGQIGTSFGNSSCFFQGQSLNADGSCSQVNGTFFNYFGLDQAPGPSRELCNANASSNVPRGSQKDGRTCEASQPFGAGCSGGNVCAPPLGDPYVACVAAKGAMACPSGYSIKHDCGSGVSDTRGCTQCQCAPTSGGSCSGTITFYSDACNTSIATITDNTCVMNNSPGPGQHTVYYRYSATGGGGTCDPNPALPPVPNGQATLQNEETVCCLR